MIDQIDIAYTSHIVLLQRMAYSISAYSNASHL